MVETEGEIGGCGGRHELGEYKQGIVMINDIILFIIIVK
jgi:hypothetical protein